jgi:radical SAM protein (TIGR01212 family)
MRYTKYSTWLKTKYGGKVYKLPINLPCTCPNRDGLLSRGGCIFCGEIGTGFEANPASYDVKAQLSKSMARIAPKYKPDYYIAYFQNYTNTYLPIKTFQSLMVDACIEGVVGISISTRPDCIGEPYLKVLDTIKAAYGVEIEIELGLQSANDATLKIINRGHDVATFKDAVKRVHAHGFTVCAHLIGNLPWDDDADNLAAIALLKALGVEGVKIHSLYILKHTVLGEMYQNGEITLIGYEAYLERLIKMVRHLPETVVIQRLFGRAPEEDTLFCNWQMSWRKLQNEFEARLEALDVRQGDLS